MEEALGEIVRSVNKTSAASGLGGQANLVTPEGLAVFLEVLEDDGELLSAVSKCFDRWSKPNSTLRRLCGIKFASLAESVGGFHLF